jgi:hypothetical protein
VPRQVAPPPKPTRPPTGPLPFENTRRYLTSRGQLPTDYLHPPSNSAGLATGKKFNLSHSKKSRPEILFRLGRRHPLSPPLNITSLPRLSSRLTQLPSTPPCPDCSRSVIREFAAPGGLLSRLVWPRSRLQSKVPEPTIRPAPLRFLSQPASTSRAPEPANKTQLPSEVTGPPAPVPSALQAPFLGFLSFVARVSPTLSSLLPPRLHHPNLNPKPFSGGTFLPPCTFANLARHASASTLPRLCTDSVLPSVSKNSILFFDQTRPPHRSFNLLDSTSS